MYRQISAETRQAIAADYQAGVKIEAIAAQYGVSAKTTVRTVRRMGIVSRNGNGTCYILNAARIREQMARGFDTLSIARIHNLPESEIWNRLARA